MKVVRWSALRTGPPLPPGNIPGTHFCYRLGQRRDQSAAGRIMLIKNSNDTIGNRTRDLPTCSAVPKWAKYVKVITVTFTCFAHSVRCKQWKHFS